MAHLTCVGHTRDELATSLGALPRRRASRTSSRSAATRPPTPTLPARRAAPTPSSSSADPRVGDFSVGVAAHPELHPRSTGDRDADRAPPGRQAGARPTSPSPSSSSRPSPTSRLVDELAALGRRPSRCCPGSCRSPTLAQIQRIAAAARAPSSRRGWPTGSTRSADDPDAVRAVGVEVATELCADAARRRRAGPALLHAEPLHRDPRDLRQPRPRRLSDAPRWLPLAATTSPLPRRPLKYWPTERPGAP